jgi:peptidoglycan/xylan/chitin deacetylase (PgdA/CDA1 family)
MALIKKLIKQLLSLPWVWRHSFFLRQSGVVVLMYHRVSDRQTPFAAFPLALFKQQMQWLQAHCTVIAETDYLACLSRKNDRRKPVVMITFDDGQRCMHDAVYPVLKKLRLPATVFLATDTLDNGGLIWTDQVTWAINHSPCSQLRLPWDKKEWPLKTLDDRKQAIAVCKHHLKNSENDQRIHWQNQLFEALQISAQQWANIPRDMLTWDEVRRCRDVFHYGGHTHSHPIMSQLNPNSCEREVKTCQQRIQAETDKTPLSFAYPNGRASDYTEPVKTVVKNHGFCMAFSTEEGINTAEGDLFAQKRIPATAESVAELAWRIMRA